MTSPSTGDKNLVSLQPLQLSLIEALFRYLIIDKETLPTDNNNPLITQQLLYWKMHTID